MKSHMHDYIGRAQEAGKALKRYKITRPGAKYLRRERDATGKWEVVCYGCPTPTDDIDAHIINKVILTNEDAAKYSFMKLVEIPMHDAPLEINTEPEGKPVESFKADDAHPTEVPKNWRELAAPDRKKIASVILGSPVRVTSEADRILEEHTRAPVHA